MASKKKDTKKKDTKKKDNLEKQNDELDELNEFIEKTKLQKKVLSKMMDQIDKMKTNK
jgi:hypothetical protein